jgi:pilus assembly protein CpaF
VSAVASVAPDLGRTVRRQLLELVDVRELGSLGGPERRLHVREHVLRLLRDQRAILSAGELTELVNRISDDVVGLGPIERLLKDPEVSEVMVNGADDCYVERKGRLERVADLFEEGEEQVFHLIERVVAPLGLRVDESCPYVDARLPDGSRFHAVIPPLSLCGPAVTIRKFASTPLTPQDLVRLGTLSAEALEFLAACVRGRANIVVSGGASTGKTTLLGVLSSFISPGERVITIEDAAELRLSRPHVVRLEARPPNVEGRGEVTVRELVRNALRMRPDRIVVGEVRGGEALDMLQAMNTGHDGSLTTAHANSSADVLSRLETMALMSDVNLPVAHVRRQIVSAIDLVVHLGRAADGRRMAVEVSALERGATPGLRAIFRFDRVRGVVRPTGAVPSLAVRLRRHGEAIDPRWFVRPGGRGPAGSRAPGWLGRRV